MGLDLAMAKDVVIAASFGTATRSASITTTAEAGAGPTVGVGRSSPVR
jgi:hypothetical protein